MFGVTDRVITLLGIGKKETGGAALTSETDLTSAGTRRAFGNVSITAESDLTASGGVRLFGAASLTVESDASGTATRRVPADAGMTVESDVSAAGTRRVLGGSGLTVESDLSATARSTLFVSITADFDTTFEGTANATFRSVAADLSADMAVSGEAIVRLGGSAEVSAQSQLDAAATRRQFAASGLTLESGLVVSAVRRVLAAASLDSTVDATITSAPVRIRFGESELSGGMDDVTAAATRVCFGEVDMTGGDTAFTATPGTVYRLVLSTAKRSITDDWLLRRYPIDVGLSLLVSGGTVTEVEVPSQTELAEADYYFLGGRNNPITAAQRAVLVAAGYGSYIEED